MHIRPFTHDDLDAVLDLAILAWEPVFGSFGRVLGEEIFLRLYPDWVASQRAAVAGLCTSEQTDAWVADVDGAVAGFILWELNHDARSGEVIMLAVHPAHQNRGIGTALNEFALAKLTAAGMRMAIVETGGDPGHAPARRSYEKAGYTALPIVRYFKAL